LSFTSGTMGRRTGGVLIATGIFEVVLAVGFVYLGLTIDLVMIGFLVTAAILGAVGVAMIWIGLRARHGAAETDRIVASGLAGTATVTGLTQTGMALNDQPQIDMELLVSIPGRAPYPAHRTEFVPLILLARLSSGQPLPVRVDPGDPQNVIVDWSASGMLPAPSSPSGGQAETLAQVQAALAESGLPAATPYATPEQGGYTVDQLRAVVRATGVDGTATIDKLADSGEVVGDERLFTMQVTLHVPGQPDRQLQPSAATVPLTVADRIAIGQTIPVKVAPDNPGLVAFLWERLGNDGPSTLI
jgi:hypothetical protein